MEIRNATPDATGEIRDIAERSMAASYSLSPSTIENAVDKWYDDATFETKLDDDDVLLLVAERDGDLIGFSESILIDGTADILWIHVDPLYRTEGVGDELYTATVDALEDAGATTIRGHVIADNPEGIAFYEERGLTKVGEDTVEIDGVDHVEILYVTDDQSEFEAIAGPDDRTLYVDRTDVTRGTLDSIHPVYTDPEGETAYGYYCDNCGSIDTGMDTMGRIECTNCGNRSKPTRWDAAWL